jgi:NAD(P)-dependent dehydrogenase (short-subunit alcohol dehydrogenase family)
MMIFKSIPENSQTGNKLILPSVALTIINTILMGRLGVPADLVGAMILLAGSGSDFITGQTIFVDGGCTAC